MKTYLKRLLYYTIFRFKLEAMDWPYYMFCYGWNPFPPSFYFLHTKEEAEQIHENLIAELEEMILTYRKSISLLNTGK